MIWGKFGEKKSVTALYVYCVTVTGVAVTECACIKKSENRSGNSDQHKAEAEEVMERESSSVQDRILSPIAAAAASRATTPLQQQRRNGGGGGGAPFGRQFSMARMAARIRRPRRCAPVLPDSA